MRNYTTIIFAVAVIAGLIGCNNTKSGSTESTSANSDAVQSTTVDEGSYTQISMEEAVRMMEEETDFIILDVRTPEEFADKHIPNAINVPNETIGEEKIPELPQEDQIILVYCRSGNRSKQASKKLAALGYTNVYEFGGINDWPGEVVRE